MERSFVPLLRYFSGFAVLCLVINRAFSADAPLDLSMEKAMDMAESYSFTARIAQQTQDSNESQEDVQLRSMLPNITANGSYLNYNTSINPAVGTPAGGLIGIPNATISAAGVTLTQHIVGLIPLYLSLEQAAAQTRAALQKKELSQINARFLGASSFVNAQKADELLKVAKSSVEVADKQLYDAQAQFDAGKLINADVLKFKLNLENAKTVLIQAQTTYKVSFVTLAETIGVKETENIVLPQKHVSIFNQDKIKSDLPTALEAAHVQRRDILAAKENITAANYGKKVAVSSYLPTFDFIANYTRDFQAQTISYGGTTYTPNQIQDNFYYGVQFTWNLLDWGVRQAQISSAASAEHSAKISMEQVESQTRVDVTNSYLQLQSAIQVLDSSKISVQYAEDVYSQFKAQFNNGQITTTDLIAAYNDQTSARANLANAMGDLDLAVLSLQKAMGQRLTTLN
jgi:OMF family outer membrane factor